MQFTYFISYHHTDAPQPPEGPVRVRDRQRDQCIIEWSPPADDGGASVSGYLIEKRDTKRGKSYHLNRVSEREEGCTWFRFRFN